MLTFYQISGSFIIPRAEMTFCSNFSVVVMLHLDFQVKGKVTRGISWWKPSRTGYFLDTITAIRKHKIKSSLCLLYYAEACNEWRDPSPRHSAWSTQLRRNAAVVASRWQHYVRFDRAGKRSHDLPNQ